jgi:hypothetical protein
MKRGRLLAILALAAAVPAHAELQLRLSPTVRTGAAVESDLFLGAGLKPGLEITMAPSAILDVSLTPFLKLKADYFFSFAYEQVDAGSSSDQRGDLVLRGRPWNFVWIELAGRATSQRFTVVGTEEEGFVAVTAYDTLLASPGIRYLSDQIDASASYVFQSTQSRDFVEESSTTLSPCPAPSFQGSVREQAHRAVASVAWSPREDLSAGVQYRFTHNNATVGELVYESHEAMLTAAALIAGGWLRLEAGLQHVPFSVQRLDPTSCAPYRRVDDIARGGLTFSIELTPGITLEAAYGYARRFSTGREWDAGRHIGYLGLRIDVDPWVF